METSFLVQKSMILVTTLGKIQILKKNQGSNTRQQLQWPQYFLKKVYFDSSSCGSILFNCLKNLESIVHEILANTNTLKKKHIKSEKQITDLAETVTFLSEMFHQFESGGKPKEEIIESSSDQVSVLHGDF